MRIEADERVDGEEGEGVRGGLPGEEPDQSVLEDEDDSDSVWTVSEGLSRKGVPLCRRSPGIKASEVAGHQRETEARSVDILARPWI